MSTENIIQMYKDYKKSGGFGIYMVDKLINKNIQYTDIPTLLEQEQKLIELYCITYEKPITEQILENKYLNRKRVHANRRIQYKRSIIMNQIITASQKENVNPHTVDAYTQFMRNTSIHGYMNREYWKELEIMKKELIYY